MTLSIDSETQKSISIIRNLYSAINRNNIDSAVELMDVNVVRIEPDGFPTAGIYRGHADLRRHLIAGRSTWAEGTCEPLDFFRIGNKIVVPVQIRVRLKNHTEWINAQIADGFVLVGDFISEFHSFANKQAAFHWAAIEDDI